MGHRLTRINARVLPFRAPRPQELLAGYGVEGAVHVYEPRAARSVRAAAPILAVVMGTELDRSVVDLATVLAGATGAPLTLAHPQVVPATLPLVAYGRVLATWSEDAVLEDALALGESDPAGAFTLVCREIGPALVAEAVDLGCSMMVMGAPQGHWLSRRRLRRAVNHVMRHAPCRTYVVHEFSPPPLREPRMAAQP